MRARIRLVFWNVGVRFQQENAMRKFVTGLATLAAMAAGVTMMGGRSDAAGLPGSRALNDAADSVALIEKTQFIYLGRNYCFYDDAWNGPGYYWCGYAYRPGLGFGGGRGWHGWGGGGGGFHRGGGFRGGGPGGFRGGVGGGPGGFMGGGPGGFMGGGPGGFMGGGPGGFMGGGGGGPMGGGGGGPMGGVGGGVPSDIRIKHDVKLLGHLDNGLGFYRFSYNGSDKAYVGVMAQEVRLMQPGAVVEGADGYLRVYYDKLGLRMQSYDEWVASGSKLPATPASVQQ
jgi:hypothetical protein